MLRREGVALQAADLGAVALGHGSVLHVTGGRLGTLDGAQELDLGVPYRVTSWRIVPVPSSTASE